MFEIFQHRWFLITMQRVQIIEQTARKWTRRLYFRYPRKSPSYDNGMRLI